MPTQRLRYYSERANYIMHPPQKYPWRNSLICAHIERKISEKSTYPRWTLILSRTGISIFTRENKEIYIRK